jgi:hypothetical protein
VPPGPFFNGPFRYRALEGFGFAGVVGLAPLVDLGLLGVDRGAGAAFGLADAVGFALTTGLAGTVASGVGVAVGVGVADGVEARGLGVATFFGGLGSSSAGSGGIADGDLTSWPTIALRADESSPTITPIVTEAKRTRTSRRTARRMITTRRRRGGTARQLFRRG